MVHGPDIPRTDSDGVSWRKKASQPPRVLLALPLPHRSPGRAFSCQDVCKRVSVCRCFCNRSISTWQVIGLPSFTRALLAGTTRFHLPRRGRRVGLECFLFIPPNIYNPSTLSGFFVGKLMKRNDNCCFDLLFWHKGTQQLSPFSMIAKVTLPRVTSLSCSIR